jgi:hypothetical protein
VLVPFCCTKEEHHCESDELKEASDAKLQDPEKK